MKALTEYRAENGMTQREFAKLVGIDQSMLSRIEKRLSSPSLEVAAEIERITAGEVRAVSLVKSQKNYLSNGAPSSADAQHDGSLPSRSVSTDVNDFKGVA